MKGSEICEGRLLRQNTDDSCFSRTLSRSCHDVRGASAPSTAQVCDPPCLSMRNNAPVEHCVAEAFILHREIVLTMKASFTLRTYLMIKITSAAR